MTIPNESPHNEIVSENKNTDPNKPQETGTGANPSAHNVTTDSKPENNPQTPPAPSAATSSQPQTPPSATPASPPVKPEPQGQKSKPGSNMKMLILSLVMFLLGIGGGILLFMTYPKTQEKAVPATPSATPTPAPLSLPADAQKIDECVDGEGEAYVSRSSPDRNMRYLSFKGKLVGFQYKLSGDNLNFNNLKLPKADIDHASVRIAKNITPLMLRPEVIGSPEPTAEFSTMEVKNNPAENSEDIFVNFFLVDSKASTGILCEAKRMQIQMSSPSANAVGGVEMIEPVMQTQSEPIDAAAQPVSPAVSPTSAQ